MRIADDVTQLIGNTPLVRIHRMAVGLPGTVLAKLEYFNAGKSVKDRIGLSMIEAAEKAGLVCRALSLHGALRGPHRLTRAVGDGKRVIPEIEAMGFASAAIVSALMRAPRYRQSRVTARLTAVKQRHRCRSYHYNT